ncbi:MAG: polymerase, sigma-24 subunit, subfamily [Pedosphaera sp.]|nr:polymerase, sigma-24 subunit, subfamily [Pedosphaera sp.]
MNTTIAPQYLEQLVEEHYQSLYRFAYSLAGNPADAADLTQQTFYIAQVKLHQLRDLHKVKSWLSVTLMREFLQKRRHETKFQKIEIGVVEHELPTITVDLVARMDSKSVVAALQALPEDFRVPLVLFYLEQMSYKEIARVLKLPAGTVMSRLARGKAQLRHELERLTHTTRHANRSTPHDVATNAPESPAEFLPVAA